MNVAVVLPGSWGAVTDQLQRDAVTLISNAVLRVPALVIAVLVLIATKGLAKLARRSVLAVMSRAVKSFSLRVLAEKAAGIGVWVAGLLLAALLVFPTLRLGDLIATLGLSTVAIGFAFADIFKNFFAGVLLLINEPFRIGDQIVVTTFEGTVEQIDLRFTVLRTYRGERVLIPNTLVFTSAVQINTAYGQRRTDLQVGVVYGSDLTRARSSLARAIASVEDVLDEPAPIVDLVKFDDSSIDAVVRYWTAPLRATTLRVQTRAILAIDAALREDGVEIAFPTRMLVVDPASVAAVAEAVTLPGRLRS